MGAVLLVTGAGAADAALAAPGRPGQEAGTVQVELVDQTPWVRPGEQMHLRFRVSPEPPGASASLVVHDRLVTRGDFTDTLDGDLGGTKSQPPGHPLTELNRGTDGTYELTVTVTVGGGTDGISLPEDGVYPVQLLVTDASGNVLTSLVTYLLLLPPTADKFPPLGVAVVMEIGGPPGLKPDGTVQPDDATIGHVNDRIKALEQAPNVPLTVAAVPETLDTLAGWGEPGVNTLDRLRRAVGTREVLSRPYVDLDLDSLVAAGLLPQTAPEAMAGAQVLRERLREPLEQTWLTGPTVGDAEVNALRDLGISRVVMPESAVEGLADPPEGPVPVGPVDLTDGGPLAAVSDDALASRLLGDDGALDVQRFLAELTMIQLSRPSITDRAVVVRIPEDAPVDPEVLGRALEALTGGATQAISMSEYFALTPVGGEEPVVIDRTADEAVTDLRSLTRPLENAQRAVSGLAATLDNRTTIQSLHRSLLISLGADLTMAQRRAYIGRVGAVVGRVADGVNAPPDFTITLTARTGTIPLTIENRTNQTVSVDVLLQSSQLEFPDGDQMNDVDVPVGGRRIDLKVRTRTSGAFPLHITLASPDRNVVYDRTTFTIRSTAVSGVGLVLSVGAGAFLLIWWARHWRTARRSRRLVNGGGTAAPPGSPDPTGSPTSALASLSTLSSSSSTPPPPTPPSPTPPPPGPPPRPGTTGRPGPPGWTGRRGTTVRHDDPH